MIGLSALVYAALLLCMTDKKPLQLSPLVRSAVCGLFIGLALLVLLPDAMAGLVPPFSGRAVFGCFIGGTASRVNGFEVNKIKAKNAAATEDCTAKTRALSVGGRLPPNHDAQAPNSVKINTHNSKEPS